MSVFCTSAQRHWNDDVTQIQSYLVHVSKRIPLVLINDEGFVLVLFYRLGKKLVQSLLSFGEIQPSEW